MNNEIDIIISMLDDTTLAKIKRKCESYINYSIDNKQVNKRYEIKTRTQVFASLLEKVNAQLVFNQFELSTKKISENNNIISTLNEEGNPVKESKKKEK